MTEEDAFKIQKLQDKGYLVMVDYAYGDTFTQRYNVYQQFGSKSLKTVIVDDDGNVVGAQG